MNSLTRFETWYGRDEAPPQIVPLRAGAVQMMYSLGDLRYVRVGERELLRRIYVAIRDVNWNTLPAIMSDEKIDRREDRFEITFQAKHLTQDIDFSWQATITGSADGTVTYRMEGTAHTDFRYCRIGFCILHPLEGILGGRYVAQTPDGEVSGVMPTLIAPQTMVNGFEIPMFPACSALRIETTDGLSVETIFEGDLFEMEDQRNWTDGSFKTYCTPLALGYPHQAQAGQSFAQTITVRTIGTAPALPDTDTVTITLGESSSRALPKIGFELAPDLLPMSERQERLLSALRPAHVRVALHLGDAVWLEYLTAAQMTAKQTGAALELMLFLTDSYSDALEALRNRLLEVPVARVIVFHEQEAAVGTTSPQWIDLVRSALTPALPGVPIFGGTDGNFAEINRQRPDPHSMDGVSYTLNPQVHASDELSLIEALEAQRDTVETTRAFFGARPIVISGISLKPPFNQAATEAETSVDADALPANVDARQMSLFAAGWTVGSLRALATDGVDALSYYQVSGWRGLMEMETGSRLPTLFRSFPGMVFPVYWIFDWLATHHDWRIAEMNFSHPRRIEGFALRSGAKLALMIANLHPELENVALRALPSGSGHRLRLNSDTMILAAADPTIFRQSAAPIQVDTHSLDFELQPYEITFLSITPNEMGEG